MQKSKSRRAVVGIHEHPNHAGKPSAVCGTTSKREPGIQLTAVDARKRHAMSVRQPVAPEMEGDRLEIAVLEMQVDNIHLELDTQMRRTAQLETLLTEIEDTLHELTEMVRWLRHEVSDKSASVEGSPRNV
jgi:hypothetical protein